MQRKPASEFPREVLDLFDQYVHGGISRRQFVERAARFAVGGLTGAALLSALSPNYAWAEQVKADDPRIETARVGYEAPQGNGKVEGLLARPAGKEGELPAVLVVHENRGLNPYIEDVARRLAVAGYLALAPDGLTSLGGYPGTDDEGRALQRKLDREKLVEDFLAGARWLKAHEAASGRVGVVGFCFGGMVSNQLAVRMGGDLQAAVPFYGTQPEAEEAAQVEARLLLHFAEEDKRVNAGWPAWKAALEQHGVSFEAHTYPGTNHGFHNDTTPRYDEAAAKLAWERTLACFAEALKA